MIKKLGLGLFGLVMVSFAAVMIILFLNEYNLVKLSNEYVELCKRFQTILTCIAVFVGFVAWVCAFAFDGITKYKLHDIAGIIGSAMFMIAFIGIVVGVNLSSLFILGGFFCFYCVLIPLITAFSGKFSNDKWEPALLWTIIASISIYGMSTLSNVIINEIFGIEAKFFSQTKPIAMLLVATPLTALISFMCLLLSILPLIRKNEKVSFYSINGFFASYAILMLSLAYGGNISGVLERTATFADFNSNHPCTLSDEIKGVIFLDPNFKNVLVYNPTLDKKYFIQPCNIGENGQIDESEL